MPIKGREMDYAAWVLWEVWINVLMYFCFFFCSESGVLLKSIVTVVNPSWLSDILGEWGALENFSEPTFKTFFWNNTSAELVRRLSMNVSLFLKKLYYTCELIIWKTQSGPKILFDLCLCKNSDGCFTEVCEPRVQRPWYHVVSAICRRSTVLVL